MLLQSIYLKFKTNLFLIKIYLYFHLEGKTMFSHHARLHQNHRKVGTFSIYSCQLFLCQHLVLGRHILQIQFPNQHLHCIHIQHRNSHRLFEPMKCKGVFDRLSSNVGFGFWFNPTEYFQQKGFIPLSRVPSFFEKWQVVIKLLCSIAERQTQPFSWIELKCRIQILV